jgi:hypothetical protein
MLMCYTTICYSPVEADMAPKNQDRTLNWEYPADRDPGQFLLVRIDDAEKEGGGIFGIRRSPSLAGAMPDAMNWTGTIVDGESSGDRVHIRVPGEDVPSVHKGDRVALGIVEGTTCICVLVPPANLDLAQARAWLAGQSCRTP